MRSSQPVSVCESAPQVETDPTSSWSKVTPREIECSQPLVAPSMLANASKQAQVETRLSTRGAEISDWSTPTGCAGIASKRQRSTSQIMLASTPAALARTTRSWSWTCSLFFAFAFFALGSPLGGAAQRTGIRCRSGFTAKALRSSGLWRWIARFGMRRIGSATRTGLSSREPSGRWTTTRPATPRPRSNQVCQRPPP